MLDFNQINFEEFFKTYGEKLKSPEDLQVLFGEASKKNLGSQLESVAFKAKYFTGLTRIVQIRNEEVEKEYYQKIEKELLATVEDIKAALKEIVKENSFISEIFERKFFRLTQECMRNLNVLCSDLSYFKLYLNDVKRV